MDKVVFTDRDGTLIKEIGYISDPAKVELLPYTAEAIKLLRSIEFKIIVVTNQSGVGRGYFSLNDLENVNNRFIELLKQEGTWIDKLYFCPHTLTDNCNCRKPKTGMIEQAKKEYDIDFANSYMVGDSAEDMELGRRTGLKTILVLTGYGEKTKSRLVGTPASVEPAQSVQPDFIAQDLLTAVNWVLSQIM